MGRRKLDFCATTSGRLNRLARQGLDKLLEAFGAGLEAHSVPVLDPKLLQDVPADLPDHVAEHLKLISGSALTCEDPELYPQLLAVYTRIRSSTLHRSMAGLVGGLRDAIATPGQGSYQKGSHAYLRALNQLAGLVQGETRFALQVLPSADPVGQVVKGAADEWLALTLTLTGHIGKSLDRGEYADQIFLFDLIEQFNSLLRGKDASELAVLKGSYQALLQTGRAFLEHLRKDVELEGRQGSSLPTPTNATVFEGTSAVLNALRRMIEYGPVIEALLQGESSTILPLNVDDGNQSLLLMAGYCQAALRSLEAAIELRARSYRKTAAGLVFRLNNYRHIQRALSTSHLVALLQSHDPEHDDEAHLGDVLQQLKEQYAALWRGLVRILNPKEPLPSSTGGGIGTSKDRVKIFINECTEMVKLLSGLTVPDPEFRLALREIAKKTVMEPFEDFYARYMLLF